MYGNYVKARASSLSLSPIEIIKKELELYPYERKNTLKEPYFTQFDISETNLEFKASVTDSGICQVYNGNSLSST